MTANINNQDLLLINNVSTGFGKRTILSHVNLRVPRNTVTAITGRSGSGKSTLLGVMSGLLKPDDGEVLFTGKNIFSWSDLKRSRYRNREIGFIFQFFNLIPDLTAYQNIIYPSSLNLFKRVNHDDARYLINYLGIETIRNQLPSTLSGGELQRVAIARSIINRPRIILADEPTGNLDDSTAADIVNLFFDIKNKYGISFVIVTHDKRIVERADIHYHLEGSRLALIKDTSERTAKKTSSKKKNTAKEHKKTGSVLKAKGETLSKKKRA